jgi:hypothetical protein
VTLLQAFALVTALAVPSAEAQDIGLSGVVADATQAVLPGVTVTALHLDSGNTFVSVTDRSGLYRLGSMRPGIYTVSADLPGFTTVVRKGVDLLVGQRRVLDFEMAVSTVQETVTVTGDAPLVEVTQSSLGGNVDARQMQALPVNGRDWLQLTMLAPGSRANSVGSAPWGVNSGWYQLNLDGQQVSDTRTLGGVSPRLSRDAISEFEFVSSRFDATQGRSRGIQVNAVTKSGTNQFAGTASGYFRDDSLNARDFIVNRVLAYSNQQTSVTFGGPIRQDRAHFFGYYEGEREPNSITFTSQFAAFNIPDVLATRTQNYGGGRFDAQLSGNSRLMVRGSGWKSSQPFAGAGGATSHPSTLSSSYQSSIQSYATLIQTRGQSVLEIGGGLTRIRTESGVLPGLETSPRVLLRGYTIGKSDLLPITDYQDTYSLRVNVTSFRGRHEIKFGGDALRPSNDMHWANFEHGTLDATLGPIPANIQELFPVWNDPSTWNLAPLSPITRRYVRAFGDFDYHRAKPQFGAWFQDNWQLSPKLTLNLGVRWDFNLDGVINELNLPPFRRAAGQEWRNFGPRLGFAYSPSSDKKTVLRGGWGIYFSGVTDHLGHVSYVTGVQTVVPEFINDGRPDFAVNPYNGPAPTYQQIVDSGVRRDYATSWIVADSFKTPYSHQTSFGAQRQLSDSMAIQADYVWTADRRSETFRNINLSYNPATGANFPFSDISKRPYPEWGLAQLRFSDGRSNYHGLETALTKRFSQHWQASATYTLSATRNYDPLPINPGCAYPMNGLTMTCDSPLPVPIAPDLGGQYGFSAPFGGAGVNADQRHRAVFNGIWELPFGLQASGLYFYASGERRATTYGGNLRDIGAVREIPSRLRPNGTIVPRNDFVGEPLHRVDVRAQRRFVLGSIRVDAMVEMFNVFNRANYGSFVTDEASPLYGRPVQNANVAYQPRIVQLGFRVQF